MFKFLKVAMLAWASVLFVTAASKAEYPDRPVTVVVPYAPGGATDLIVRKLQRTIENDLGQPIVIVNIGGGGGLTGAVNVVGADPDGYTLLLTVSATLTRTPFMMRDYPFDSRNALVPVGILGGSPNLLVVHPSLSVDTLDEMVELARERQGRLSYASAGVGSPHHIAGEMLQLATGIKMAHVPYSGSGAAIQDMVAGHVPVGFGTMAAILPHSSAGSLRILATAEPERVAGLPEVPAISEVYPDAAFPRSWVAMFAPAGTPAEIVERWNGILASALSASGIAEELAELGHLVKIASVQETTDLIDAERERWEEIIPAIGLQP